MDYKSLLKKYISYINDCEGITYAEPVYNLSGFSKEEKSVLRGIDEEIKKEEDALLVVQR